MTVIAPYGVAQNLARIVAQVEDEMALERQDSPLFRAIANGARPPLDAAQALDAAAWRANWLMRVNDAAQAASLSGRGARGARKGDPT